MYRAVNRRVATVTVDDVAVVGRAVRRCVIRPAVTPNVIGFLIGRHVAQHVVERRVFLLGLFRTR